MLADDFLHPDHIVPAAEFIAAFMELADLLEAKVRVEIGASSFPCVP